MWSNDILTVKFLFTFVMEPKLVYHVQSLLNTCAFKSKETWWIDLKTIEIHASFFSLRLIATRQN